MSNILINYSFIMFVMFVLYDLFRANSELAEFVISVCGTRDETHGDVHMRKVKNNAIRIIFHEYVILWIWPILVFLGTLSLLVQYNWTHYILMLCCGFYYQDFANAIRLMYFAMIVAWLHDVADHKYINEQQQLLVHLHRFIGYLTKEKSCFFANTKYEHLFNTEKIMAIIDRISFSREERMGDTDWFQTFGKTGILIRNIVSDADKLEAIGKDGIWRCVRYSIEKIKERGITPTRELVVKNVSAHYNEKLELIASRYMRTASGIVYAKKLHCEMENELMKLINDHQFDPTKM